MGCAIANINLFVGPQWSAIGEGWSIRSRSHDCRS